jgi:hypothetical protein
MARALAMVLLGLRTAPKEDSGVSASELVYRVALALPAEFLSTAESHAEAAARPAAALLQASHVYVRRGGMLPPLSPLYVGPYEVLERGTSYSC